MSAADTFVQQNAAPHAAVEARFRREFSQQAAIAMMAVHAQGLPATAALMGAATGAMTAMLYRACADHDPAWRDANQAAYVEHERTGIASAPPMPYDRALFWGMVAVFKAIEVDKMEAARLAGTHDPAKSINCAEMAAVVVAKVLGSTPDWILELTRATGEAGDALNRMAARTDGPGC